VTEGQRQSDGVVRRAAWLAAKSGYRLAHQHSARQGES
jgi:hypothetical protein